LPFHQDALEVSKIRKKSFHSGGIATAGCPPKAQTPKWVAIDKKSALFWCDGKFVTFLIYSFQFFSAQHRFGICKNSTFRHFFAFIFKDIYFHSIAWNAVLNSRKSTEGTSCGRPLLHFAHRQAQHPGCSESLDAQGSAVPHPIFHRAFFP
jgi:hypothetical protein